MAAMIYALDLVRAIKILMFIHVFVGSKTRDFISGSRQFRTLVLVHIILYLCASLDHVFYYLSNKDIFP
jgi:hypothetical protein